MTARRSWQNFGGRISTAGRDVWAYIRGGEFNAPKNKDEKEKLGEEIERLIFESEMLAGTNVHLGAEVTRLKEENAQLQDTCIRLQAEIKVLKSRNLKK